MKLAILLLVCCCAVALAKPDGSKEVPKQPKIGSKEVNHSGEHSKGSSESKESSEDSDSKSSNESGNKSGEGGVIGIPGLPVPSIQQVELLLDRAVETAASIFGLRSIHGYVDLVHFIESNPLGNIVWTIVVHPFLRNIASYHNAIISFLASLQSTALQYFPILHLFMPLELPQAIIRFVYEILQYVAQIFNRVI